MRVRAGASTCARFETTGTCTRAVSPGVPRVPQMCRNSVIGPDSRDTQRSRPSLLLSLPPEEKHGKSRPLCASLGLVPWFGKKPDVVPSGFNVAQSVQEAGALALTSLSWPPSCC